MDSRKWWQAPMRVMQYNLQVKDTPGMDAEQIARETEELGCNAVCNPGTVIGRHSNVYPTSCVRGVVPENSIWKDNGEIIHKEER